MSTPQNTLICIPDISGFTEFMSSFDIELSSTVISALLNEVIYANKIGLKVSEIEGDAILFYRHGPLPSLSDLVEQCKRFYDEFYNKLNALCKEFRHEKEDEDYISDTLGLKIILHYGAGINSVQIGKNIKLMGEDIIIAHRLLKNKVPEEEYILISDALLSKYKEEAINSNFEWAELHELEANYKHIGTIDYSYINLRQLKY